MKKIKWLLGLCLMTLVVCGSGDSVQALNIGVSSEDEVNGTDTSKFHWSENEDGTLTITKYVGIDETVVIPSEIEGKLVTNIGGQSFYNCQTIKHVIISEGIININNKIFNGAFEDCHYLESVSLPNTLKSIGKNAFADCYRLNTINFPNNLTNIGKNSFYGCYKLDNIIFPESLINMDEECFRECTSISRITIPKNVKSLKRYIFFGCSNLQEVEIENGVQRIENRAFMECNNLKKIIIPNSVFYIDETSFTLLYDTYYDNSPKHLTIYANSNSYARKYANQRGIKFSCLNTHDWDKGAITTKPTAIKDGVKTYTCTACKLTKTEKIHKLGLPQKGKTITESSSNNNYKITKSATKNGTVEFVKASKSARSITIPDTITVNGTTYKVTSVSKNAFKNNKKLKKVTVGKNITKIKANAFYGCKNLKTVTVKSTQIETVGRNAFKSINPKAKIKVPRSKLEKYKKLFKGKGQKSTVKIVK